MKKIFVQTVLVLFITGSVFAGPGNSVSKLVKQSFEKEFAGAQSISWEKLSPNDIFHASFVMNNERYNAYFNEEGALIATGRNTKAENLPLLVSNALRAKFPEKNFEEVIEYVTNNETNYLVKFTTGKKTVIVQASMSGTITILKKEKNILK